MKPPPFAYRAPAELDEALALLHEHGSDAVVLAGGQSLIPALNFRFGAPELLVDVNALNSLAGIAVNERQLRIGALTRHAHLITSDVATSHLPVLQQAARHIGHTPIRNRGTAGGSIAHADPAAELPAILAVLDGEIELSSTSGTRTVPFSDFALGPFTTTRRPDELVTSLNLPLHNGFRWACAEITRRSGDFALAGAVAGVTLTGDNHIEFARVALFGVEPAPRRILELEHAARGAALDELTERLRSASAELDIGPRDNPEHGYRHHLALTAAQMALEQAMTTEAGAP